MGKIDIYTAIREFYLIEGLYAESLSLLTPFRHSHERWKEDFLSYREKYIAQLARAIYDYTVLVAGTEMRWASEEAEAFYEDFYNPSEIDRIDVYREISKYSDKFLLKAAIKIFNIKWDRWYGGEKWRNISMAGMLYGKVPDVLFIDHCVDLMHNGSIYFDKDTDIFHFENQFLYKKMLDNKRYCSFKNFLPYQATSTYISHFVNRINNILGKNYFPHRKGAHLVDCVIERIFKYKPIEWGDETFSLVLKTNYDWEGE